MREHYSKAPEFTRNRLTRMLADSRTCSDFAESADAAVRAVFSAGFDLHESEVPQPRTAQLATLSAKEASLFRTEFSMQLAAEDRARKLWQARRQWARDTSRQDDQNKAAQQLSEANTRRQQLTEQRFIDGLAAAVRGFIDDQWRRADLQWVNKRDPNDKTRPATQPSITDTVDRVAAALGHVRAEITTTKRKAS